MNFYNNNGPIWNCGAKLGGKPGLANDETRIVGWLPQTPREDGEAFAVVVAGGEGWVESW